jgi:hypothetical protein
MVRHWPVKQAGGVRIRRRHNQALGLGDWSSVRDARGPFERGSSKECEVTTALSSDTHTNRQLSSSRIYKVGQQPTSTPTSQMQLSDARLQTLRYNAEVWRDQ